MREVSYCLRGREIVNIACGVSASFISLGKGRMETTFFNRSSARMSGVVGCSHGCINAMGGDGVGRAYETYTVCVGSTRGKIRGHISVLNQHTDKFPSTT